MTHAEPRAETAGLATGPDQSRQDRKFRPDIEGLRAIAVLLVALNHAGLSFLAGGYVGVDVFFVLSGFLITGILVAEYTKKGSISFPLFYARRARRLLPAGALVLVVTVITSYEAFGPFRGNRIAEDSLWATLFASNVRFIQEGTDYFGAQQPPSPLQHFWSLAVEEQFYFVWPLLIIGIALIGKQIDLRRKLAIGMTLLVIGSLAWSIYQSSADRTTAYFSPFTRAYELGIGALLAISIPWVLKLPKYLGPLLGWGGLAMIFFAAIRFDEATVFPGYLALVPVLGTVLTLIAGTVDPERGAERILDLPPFQWIGKLSYSFYLWHWPVLMIAPDLLGFEPTTTRNLGLLVVALLLSGVTYLLVETPVRTSPFLVKRPSRLSLGMGASIIVATASFSWSLAAANAVPGEKTSDDVQITEGASQEQVEAAVVAGVQVETWPTQPERIQNPAYHGGCNVARKDTTSAACVFGDPNAERTVVIFGDSRAAMWIPAFDEIGKRDHWQVVQLTKPGCIAPNFPNYSNSLGREYTECGEYREWAIGKVAEIQPDVVIVTSARKGVIRSDNGEPTRDGLEDVWETGLGETLDRLAPNTDRLVLLGDSPYPEEPGIDCLSEHQDDVSACNSPREASVLVDHNAMEERVAGEHSAEYVSTVSWFCTEDVCPAVIADLTVNRDSLHISENYAVYLSHVLAQATGLTDGGQEGTPVAMLLNWYANVPNRYQWNPHCV